MQEYSTTKITYKTYFLPKLVILSVPGQ